MAVKSTGQFSFVEALAPRLTGGSGRLDRLHDLAKWYRFEKVLSGVRDEGAGRPAYPALLRPLGNNISGERSHHRIERDVTTVRTPSHHLFYIP